MTPERRKELVERRDKMRAEFELRRDECLSFLLDNSYLFEIVERTHFLRWIYENFPLDCKHTSAWIDWTRLSHYKRWFPHTNSEDAGLRLDDIAREFSLNDAAVFFDAYGVIAKTKLSYLLEFYAGELPIYDTHIWNEEERWVIEIPVVNADQNYSVNFGYSDSSSSGWKQINDSQFQKIRSTQKAKK